ncbi:MAG: ACT domain-containing protein [Candidatus Thermoplasmatota archaeon]|nr:ACT domain-containing protein [Candidatus Thermoplasmatota archaeon]
MWKKLTDKFYKMPSQLVVVRKMISVGLSVRSEFDEDLPRIFCSDIEIQPATLAKTLGIDRRAVIGAIRSIAADPDLLNFFSRLTPVANFSASSSFLGMGVIQIVPELADRPGIIAGVLSVIADAGINVRQVIVDDPEISDEPRAYVVTQSPIPSELISILRQVPGVRALVLL